MLIINNHSTSNFSVSVKQNTNKVISSSDDSFGGVGPGQYIKIGNSDILYPIAKVNKIFYLKDFNVINNKEICINENIDINLQINDTLDLLFDEYELVAVTEISDPGKYYHIDEILTINDGLPSQDINNGLISPTKLKVEEIDLNGGVVRVSAVDYGRYIRPPEQFNLSNSKLGTNLKLKLQYNPLSNKKILKRVIKSIEIKDGKSYLKLDYSLPPGLQNGKISVQKWEIELTSLYLDSTKYGSNYFIVKNFTPNIKLPLLVKNSLSTDIIYNQAISILDNEINNLKLRIKELESKVIDLQVFNMD